MVHGGAALARLPDGQVALVKGGIPGEEVEAELRLRAGVLQGTVTGVLTPDPARCQPSPHPGLDYSHISYNKQLQLKRQVVQDALLRSLGHEVGQGIAVPPLRASPELWGYRHAVQPVVAGQALGYRRPESHEPVTLSYDPVAHDSLNAVWRQWPGWNVPNGIRELALRCNAAGAVLACLIADRPAREYLDFAHRLLRAGITGVSYAAVDPRGRFRSGSERLAGRRTIVQRYGRFELTVTATSFAQPNPAAAGLLYGELEAWVDQAHTALDLYAGSGVIAMHLAAKAQRVVAWELDRGSVARGERDAERLGLSNLTFVRADARQVIMPPEVDLIAVNPPRTGLAKPVREAIITSHAERLIYVSCDVATWARDVAHFVGAGFRLEKMQPYDFYPHTHHIELLSLLSR
jgi:tRNA/tmRNA/rRNA uracil-C5-methylase (TrmA/RlmC/RlmD family)